MDLNAMAAARLRALAADGGLDTPEGLNRALRTLAIWRSKLIEAELVRRHGLAVLSGPFAGMRFHAQSAEGCLAAKLLGCYEAQLHPHLIEAASGGYADVVDIGCAEGYYAVGLARLMPGARVHAHDTNPAAQAACRELAGLNGVAERVAVGGLFRGEDFAGFKERTLVVVDVEGAEDGLLRPDLYPALAGMSVIVECHDVFRAGLCEAIAGRFRATHAVRRIDAVLTAPLLPTWFERTTHLDQLLATWEWRSGPTPWLVMHPRAPR